jgi:glycosyltransferase involved in cell wall biosynthesis
MCPEPAVRQGSLSRTDSGSPDLARASMVPYSVVVPAFNEEEAIREEIEALRKLERHPDCEIIVVDDGSTDRTGDVAESCGVTVLRHSENRGYGASLKTGILEASHEVIVILDADGTYPAESIPRLVEALAHADMAVGARQGRDVRVPTLRRPAKWILGKLANAVAAQKIPDLNSGLRAFRRDLAVHYFPLLSESFSFTSTITLALLADGYRVAYLPISYKRRVGRSKITPRHFMDFLILVFRTAMLFHPLRVFVPLALVVGGLGIFKVIFDIASLFLRVYRPRRTLIFEPVLSTSAILLLLAALQLILVGMVADGVLRRLGRQEEPTMPARRPGHHRKSGGL